MLQEKQDSEAAAKFAANKKGQLGTGNRSEKIRTYNFPQDRVTDHRIGLDLHSMGKILDGDIQHLIDALVTTDQADKLAGSDEEGA